MFSYVFKYQFSALVWFQVKSNYNLLFELMHVRDIAKSGIDLMPLA